MKKSFFFFWLTLFLTITGYAQTAADSAKIVPEIRKVVFLPFSNDGDSDYNWISRALIYIVNNKMAVVSGLYAADDETVNKSINEIGFKPGIISEKQASQLGKLTHSDIIVSGRYSDEDSRLSIQTAYHNATNGQKLYEEGMLASSKAIAKVADKIVLQLLQILGLPENDTKNILKNTNLTENSEAMESFIKAYLAIESNPPDTDKAIDLFENAIDEDAQFWEAHYNLGVLYFNENEYNEARVLFDKLIAATPGFYKSYFGRGLINENVNNYAAAITDFQKVTELNPNDYLAYLHLARANRMLKNFEEAKENLNMAKALSADYAPLFYEAGNLLVDQGKPNVAIDQYRKAIELNPDKNQFHQGLGEAYYKARVYYNALYEFKLILERDPDNPYANFMLGITIYKQAVLEEIIDAFLDILNETEASKERSVRFQKKAKADSLKQQTVYAQMAEAFGKAASGRPDFMQAKFNLALTYLEMGEYEKAEKYFLETQAIAPDLIQAYTKLAEVYEETNRRHLAIEQYKRAFYIEPSIYMRKPTLDAVHQYINVIDRFMADLNRRLESNPNDIEANLTMAKVNIERGNLSGAKDILDKILQLQPTNSKAKQLLLSLKE